MKKFACLAAILAIIPVFAVAAEIPGYSITSLPSQVVAEYLDNGNFLLLVQDFVEGDIYLLEVSLNEELVSTTHCPYDTGKEISFPTMKVWDNYVHLVYSAGGGYGRYCKYGLNTKQWGGLIKYNSSLTTKIYETSIDIDEDSGTIYVAAIGQLSRLGSDLSVIGLKSDDGMDWNGWLGGDWRRTLLISDDSLKVDQSQVSIFCEPYGIYGKEVNAVWLDPRESQPQYDIYCDTYFPEADSLWANEAILDSHDATSCHTRRIAGVAHTLLMALGTQSSLWARTASYKIIDTRGTTFFQIDGYSPSQVAAAWEVAGEVFYSTATYENSHWKASTWLGTGACPVIAAGSQIFVAYNSIGGGITAEVLPWLITRDNGNCLE